VQLHRHPGRPGPVHQRVEVAEVRLWAPVTAVSALAVAIAVAQQPEHVVEVGERGATRLGDGVEGLRDERRVAVQHPGRGARLQRRDRESVSHGVVQLPREPVAFGQRAFRGVRGR
jgi:hypothetical protein